MESKKNTIHPREVLGNHRWKSQQSRLDLGAVSQPWILAGRTIFVADAHRDDGKRFVVHADEKLTAFADSNREDTDEVHRKNAQCGKFLR